MRLNRLAAAAAVLLVTVQCSAAGAGKSASGWGLPPPDSPDPNIGWHTEGGWRVCRYDCDNPEAPGSGYRCRSFTFLGMTGRECEN